MDFPDLRRTYYKGIKFELSDLFDRDYSNDYVLTDEALTKVIYSLDLNFSVEKFSEEDAELIQYAFDDEISAFDAVHDNYILKRRASLDRPSTSVKKEVPKEVGYPGYIQVVHGNQYGYGEDSSYLTATIQVGGEYYVFQLIGRRDNMGYLYDDFIDILASVHT